MRTLEIPVHAAHYVRRLALLLSSTACRERMESALVPALDCAIPKPNLSPGGGRVVMANRKMLYSHQPVGLPGYRF